MSEREILVLIANKETRCYEYRFGHQWQRTYKETKILLVESETWITQWRAQHLR